MSLHVGMVARTLNVPHLRGTGRYVQELLRNTRPSDDLSWTAFVALWVLWVWGDQESRHLAEGCSVSRATISGVVRTLESRGFVVRRSDSTDGRKVVVGLTASGRPASRRLSRSPSAPERTPIFSVFRFLLL